MTAVAEGLSARYKPAMASVALVRETTRELRDLAATEALAGRVAAIARTGDVIGLSGALGAGKTTFARFFIVARGGAEEVPSPTFSLVQIYPLAGASVWHIDLYRLQRAEEAFELGIEDAFDDGISLIEWPERMVAHLPADWLEIAFSWGEEPTARRVSLRGHGAWAARLAAVASDD